MKPLIAIALCTASLVATAASAQPYGRGPGPAPAYGYRGGDGGDDPRAPDAFAGVSKEAFYSVEQRMGAIEQRIRAMGRRGFAAMAQMRQIRGFERQQRARHGGELRDWDREAINVRLDRLVGRYRLG